MTYVHREEVVGEGHPRRLEEVGEEEDRLHHLVEGEVVVVHRHRLGEEVVEERRYHRQHRLEEVVGEEHPCLVGEEEEEHRPCH